MLINSVDSETIKILTGGIGVIIKDYGVITTAEVIGGYKCCYCPCVLHQELIKIKPKYPCDDCTEKEVGFSIFKNFDITGRAQDYYGTGKPFYYQITDPLDSTTGYLLVDDIEEATANIVYQIGNAPPNVQEFVYAYERVRLDYTVGVMTLVVKSIADGTEWTYTGANIIALAASINADATRRIEVINSSATHITIEGHAGFGFTLPTKTNFTTQDDDYYWIRIKQKACGKDFTIRDYDGTGTRTLLQAPHKSKVDPKDVARVFPILPLSVVGTQRDVPVKDGHYCIYRFEIKHPYAYAHSFANHLDEYVEQLLVYVLDTGGNIFGFDVPLAQAGIEFAKFYDTTGGCDCSSSSYDNSTAYA